MNNLNVRKNDNVIVISGKDKGKKGKIIAAYPSRNRVAVQGANIVTRHKKPRKQGEPGGRIEHEGTIDASKVMLVCPKCGKATRIAHRTETVTRNDGKQKNSYVRVCKKCGKDID